MQCFAFVREAELKSCSISSSDKSVKQITSVPLPGIIHWVLNHQFCWSVISIFNRRNSTPLLMGFQEPEDEDAQGWRLLPMS